MRPSICDTSHRVGCPARCCRITVCASPTPAPPPRGRACAPPAPPRPPGRPRPRRDPPPRPPPPPPPPRPPPSPPGLPSPPRAARSGRGVFFPHAPLQREALISELHLPN